MTQSFTSNPINATSAGGGWDLLSTATASVSATLDFETSIDSTYFMYAFVVEDLQPDLVAGADAINIRTSTDGGIGGGGSYDAGASEYAFGSNSNAGSTASQNTFINTATAATVVTNAPVNGVIYMMNPSNASAWTGFTGVLGYTTATGTGGVTTFSGHRKATEIVNAVRIYFQNDDIKSGTIKLYGCCKPA